MILRICEFLISSVNTSPAGTNTFDAAAGLATASVFAAVSVVAAVCGPVAEAGLKFSISLLMLRPFSPDPLTGLIEFLCR
jgi:hypothetical protein